MKKKIPMMFVFFVYLMVLVINAQDNCDEIFVTSWKTGKETITTEQKFDITLSSNKKEFQSEIVADSGKRYKLSLNYIPILERKLSETGKTTESWKIELREIYPDKEESLGENLIKYEGIGGGGDNFPREDLVGYIYLKDKSLIRSENLYLIDGKFYFPPKSKRVVKVENFYVVIQVKDFQLNSLDKHKVDYLNISIDFKNTILSHCNSAKY